MISGKAYSTKPFHVIDRFFRSSVVKPQQKQAEQRKNCSKESGAGSVFLAGNVLWHAKCEEAAVIFIVQIEAADVVL